MIIDHVNFIGAYKGLSKNFATAVHFIETCNLNALETGAIEIDGKNVYAVVTDKQLTEMPSAWEAHKRYTDIHLVISGSEKIGYAPLHAGTGEGAYDAEKDILFYESVGGHFARLTAGEYMMALPQDIHIPNCPDGTESHARKLILKVLMEE